MYNLWSQNTECNLKYIPIITNIENSNQLPQQLKHTRTKLYIYVIPEYRIPWLEIYKYPLPDTCKGLKRVFLFEPQKLKACVFGFPRITQSL